MPTQPENDINQSEDDLPQTLLIRRSKTRYVLHIVISVIALGVVIYTAVAANSLFNFLTILFVIMALAFGLFSLKRLLDRSVQLQMTSDGITFNDGAHLKWKEINHCRIETKTSNVGRNADITNYYLHIETIFSGQVTGHPTEKIVQVTGLEYAPDDILYLIRSYKRKHH